MMQVTGAICPENLKQNQCKNPECKFFHISHFQFSFDQVLEVNDLFYLKTQISSHEPANRTFSASQLKLLSEEPCPILCSICKNLIKESDCYFSCCDSYACRKCVMSWKFNNYCPTCGAFYQSLDYLKIPPKQQVVKVNKSFAF